MINAHSHGPIVLAGDFNAHVGRLGGPRGLNPQNLHGKLLLELVNRNDLYFTSLNSCTNGSCYTFFRNDIMSTVHYIITDAISAPLVQRCSILDLNTSDHLPLSITLACETQFKHNNASPRAHLNWKRGLCDGSVDLFVARINNLLRPLIGKNYTSPLELNEEVRSVSESIASSSIPHFKPRKPKTRFIHDPQLQHLSTKCKVAWRKWCEAGRPNKVLYLRTRTPSSD